MSLKNEDRYNEELEKLFKEENITVIDCDGKEITGKLLGIEKKYLNCIIMTDKEKIIIRNPKRIIKKRDKSWEKKDRE